jgi:hypothetical protein
MFPLRARLRALGRDRVALEHLHSTLVCATDEELDCLGESSAPQRAVLLTGRLWETGERPALRNERVRESTDIRWRNVWVHVLSDCA